jgi:hypothetical protein
MLFSFVYVLLIFLDVFDQILNFVFRSFPVDVINIIPQEYKTGPVLSKINSSSSFPETMSIELNRINSNKNIRVEEEESSSSSSQDDFGVNNSMQHNNMLNQIEIIENDDTSTSSDSESSSDYDVEMSIKVTRATSKSKFISHLQPFLSKPSPLNNLKLKTGKFSFLFPNNCKGFS